MKYVNQLQHPHMLYVTRTDPDCDRHEWGKTSTVRSSGCGLCSAIMVADRLIPNCDFDLYDAIELSYETAANHGPGTDYKRFAPAFAEKMGLRLALSWDIEELSDCLRTGGAAVALVSGRGQGQGLFTRGGHYIAVINEEPDGRFAILDPSYKEAKFDEPDRIGKVEIKNGVIVLCDKPTLENEKPMSDSAPYYLFWRK